MGLMIVIGLSCRVIAAFIGEDKNFAKVGSFVLGASLNVIGVIILLALTPRRPTRPGQSEWSPAQRPITLLLGGTAENTNRTDKGSER